MIELGYSRLFFPSSSVTNLRHRFFKDLEDPFSKTAYLESNGSRRSCHGQAQFS